MFVYREYFKNIEKIVVINFFGDVVDNYGMLFMLVEELIFGNVFFIFFKCY